MITHDFDYIVFASSAIEMDSRTSLSGCVTDIRKWAHSGTYSISLRSCRKIVKNRDFWVCQEIAPKERSVLGQFDPQNRFKPAI